jgi:hypothetical protein
MEITEFSNHIMAWRVIRVKVINGVAIEVGSLLSECHHSLIRSKIAKLMNKYWVDKYCIKSGISNNFQPAEGGEYLGWPCGNGKIYLMENTEENLQGSIEEKIA